MNIVVVIPAYNEGKTIGDVIEKCKNIPHPASGRPLPEGEGRVRALVVDDGSHDRTAEIAKVAGATVLRHPINRGLGAAISTGIEGALMLLCHPEVTPKDPALRENHEILRPAQNDRSGGVIVTLDADGQHDPAEITRLIEPILRGEAEVVIGSRFMTLRHPEVTPKDPVHIRTGFFTPLRSVQNDECVIPRTRRIANFCGNFFTWLLFGIWVTDSQSGFRAFSYSAAQELRLRTSTMEVSSEIVREIARLRLKMVEVPIAARYTAYSLSKGQGLLRGLETLWKLVVLRFFR